MRENEMSNYGKGLVEISFDPDYKKLKNQMGKIFIIDLFKEIGFFNLVRLMCGVSKEKKKMRKHDWSSIEKHGFHKENLNFIVEDIACMKVLVDILGESKACTIFSDVLAKINKKLVSGKSIQNILMIPEDEMQLCDDKFIAFKEYIKAGEAAMEKEGAHKINILQDTDDTLAFNVNYCIAHEVAKNFGSPILGFPWCHIDDIALPIVGNHLGFKYFRTSTLCSGASMCDFRFDRLQS